MEGARVEGVEVVRLYYYGVGIWVEMGLRFCWTTK